MLMQEKEAVGTPEKTCVSWENIRYKVSITNSFYTDDPAVKVDGLTYPELLEILLLAEHGATLKITKEK